MRVLLSTLLISVLFIGCNNPAGTDHAAAVEQDSAHSPQADTANSEVVAYDGEKHFRNLRQLTNGGENAEAYWSFDNQRLVFQAANADWQADCDQIFTFDPTTDNLMEQQPQLVSTGLGRTTCAYFLPGDSTIVYASTHLADSACPPVPERRADGKYVWPIYPGYDIFLADINGNQIAQLTDTPGYDAEATVSPKGDKMVFTSMRSGDLELYTMNLDGSDVRQITDALGYDGGAFFSPDGEKIIFRASRPSTEEEIATYRSLLDEGLVMPTQMELFVCNSDGSDLRQITQLGQANWCPFFHPSGEKVIFASNHTSKRGFPFNLYMIDLDGSNLKQISRDESFDAFPMFSPDGKKLIFSSNRNNGGTRETNLFVADWVE